MTLTIQGHLIMGDGLKKVYSNYMTVGKKRSTEEKHLFKNLIQL